MINELSNSKTLLVSKSILYGILAFPGLLIFWLATSCRIVQRY